MLVSCCFFARLQSIFEFQEYCSFAGVVAPEFELGVEVFDLLALSVVLQVVEPVMREPSQLSHLDIEVAKGRAALHSRWQRFLQTEIGDISIFVQGWFC